MTILFLNRLEPKTKKTALELFQDWTTGFDCECSETVEILMLPMFALFFQPKLFIC